METVLNVLIFIMKFIGSILASFCVLFWLGVFFTVWVNKQTGVQEMQGVNILLILLSIIYSIIFFKFLTSLESWCSNNKVKCCCLWGGLILSVCIVLLLVFFL